MTRLRILSGKAADAETQIFADILRTLSKAIRVKWERDERTKHRKELIKVTEGKLFEWKSMPMQDICQKLHWWLPLFCPERTCTPEF